MSETPAIGPAGAPDAPRRRRVAPWIALAIAVVVGALFVVLAGASPEHADPTTGELVGKPAPAVQTTTFDGQRFDLGRRRGSWVVLNFFDTKCVECKKEHPELVTFAAQQREPGALGVELYTVVNNDTDANVSGWFADHGGDWPVLHDDDGHIAVSFGVAQIPETWIVDPNGTIVARYPYAVRSADEITNVIDRLAGRPA